MAWWLQIWEKMILELKGSVDLVTEAREPVTPATGVGNGQN